MSWAGLLLLVLALTGCAAGNQPSSVTWRNVELQLPDGWYLLEDTEERLRIANRDLPDDLLATLPATGEVTGAPAQDPGAPGRASGGGTQAPDGTADPAAAYRDAVVMTFTHEPGTLPDDWRAWVEAAGGTIESDLPIVLEGDVPATRLVYRRELGDTSTRELLVAIPSRSIVLVAGPAVPTRDRPPTTSSDATAPTTPGTSSDTTTPTTPDTSSDTTDPASPDTPAATELFLTYVERFLEVLESARFGAPLE